MLAVMNKSYQTHGAVFPEVRSGPNNLLDCLVNVVDNPPRGHYHIIERYERAVRVKCHGRDREGEQCIPKEHGRRGWC